ncbi:MAG TPA: hypothetical protein DDZ41_11545 [Flavobacterium sp.]|nr:hypothetical protein [Flavobacterium sp.]
MKMQMSGQGKGMSKPGSGNSGKQLSDIIKQQEGLSNKVKDGLKAGEKPGNKEDGSLGSKPSAGKSNNQDGDGTDGDAGKILEILKEQQQLRDALQKSLAKRGINGSSILSQMKDIEKQLINKGFNKETLQKMLNIKHELLKLENALQQQGEDEKRKSNSSNDVFKSTVSPLPKELQEYIKSIEILNRQSLPLQKSFDTRVNTYFNIK